MSVMFEAFLWKGIHSMARLIPLFSGSSGNSYYIGTKEAGILIDAGRSAKQMTEMMKNCGIDPLAVHGIFVTHEHTDHVNGLRVFASKYNTPVFASAGTLAALQDMGIINGKYPTYLMESGIQLAGMEISNFHTSHDCAEGCGYKVRTSDGKYLALATDLGYVSDEVQESVIGCDFTIIESNHDVGMLKTGSYPYPLKRRILSDFGHLSNECCADLLPKLYKSGTKRIMLAHLSSENNTPDIAYQTSLCSMTMNGYVKDVDFTLAVAPKANTAGTNIIF